MALQRRAVATNTDGGTAGLTAVLNAPSGTLSGDLIIAAIMVADSIGTLAISAPDGTWTQQTTLAYSDGGSQHIDIWTKTAGGSEPSTYNFTYTGTTGGANQAWLTAAVGIYSDASGSVVVDQKASAGAAGTGWPNFATPSITPGVNNERVLSFFCQDQAGATAFTWTSTGPTELADFRETVTNLGAAVYEEDQTTATATSHTAQNTGTDTSRGVATAILSVKEVIAASSAPMRMLMGVGT